MKSLIKSSSIVLVGSIVVNVLNYAFTLIISRLLGVTHFGEVTSLMSLFLILTVPSAALTLFMARETATYQDKNIDTVFQIYKYLSKRTVIASIVFWLLVASLSPLISAYLNISYTSAIAFSFLIPFSLINSINMGMFQGLQKFVYTSSLGIAGTVIKLALSFLLVLDGLSVLGVIIALVFSEIVVWLIGSFVISKMIKKTYSEPKSIENKLHAIDLKNIYIFFATSLVLTLLTNIDIVLAKHYLSESDAGLYSALSTAGKIVIYGISAFITVLLPMAASESAKGKGGEKKIFFNTILIILAISAGVSLVFFSFPNLIISILFGSKYLGISKYLGLFSVFTGIVALIITFINYFTAIKNTFFVILTTLGLALEIFLIMLYGRTVYSITLMLLISSIFTLLLLTANYFLTTKKS